MRETLEDPEIEQRAIAKAIETAAPMRLDETMAQYGRRVAEFACNYFETEVDIHRRKQNHGLAVLAAEWFDARSAVFAEINEGLSPIPSLNRLANAEHALHNAIRESRKSADEIKE